MQHLQDLAAESCAGICLLHISYEFSKLAVAKHRLRDSSPQSTDSKSDALSMRPRGLLQPSHMPHVPAVNLKRHAQLLVCRAAATTLRECNVNPHSAEHQRSSGRIHRCHRCGPGSIPGCCSFFLLGQPFLQILLRVMRRVRAMWCRGIKANTTHATMPCRSLLLCQHNWARGPMDKASAYGAGDCRFESCRAHFCVHMQQHGLTSIIHQSSCGMMFASVRHAELENE